MQNITEEINNIQIGLVKGKRDIRQSKNNEILYGLAKPFQEIVQLKLLIFCFVKFWFLRLYGTSGLNFEIEKWKKKKREKLN